MKGIELHRHKHGHESDTRQDEMRMPKPGTFKNKLVAKYGTNFRYLGKVKNGLDRVTVVTSIPIPRFEKIQVQSINFAKCAKIMEMFDKDGKHLMTMDTQAIKAAKEWCARATLILNICSNRKNITLKRYMTF